MALHKAYLMICKPRGLGGGLYTHGRHIDGKVTRDGEDAFHRHLPGATFVNAAHEQRIDLDDVRLEIHERAETRVPLTKVIGGDAKTRAPIIRQDRKRRRAGRGPFLGRDLKQDAPRRETSIARDIEHSRYRARGRACPARGQIDGKSRIRPSAHRNRDRARQPIMGTIPDRVRAAPTRQPRLHLQGIEFVMAPRDDRLERQQARAGCPTPRTRTRKAGSLSGAGNHGDANAVAIPGPRYRGPRVSRVSREERYLIHKPYPKRADGEESRSLR